jgi:hypothetical protein
MMLIAGGSKAAARRAAALGLGFISQADVPGLKEFTKSSAARTGTSPASSSFPFRALRPRSSSLTTSTRRGRCWGLTCYTTR